jgi:hypothetical protein
MPSAAAALLAGQKAALEASAGLALAFGVPAGATPRVFDAVPTNAALPLGKPGYVVLGDGDDEADESDECQEAWEIVSNIGIWLRPDPPNAAAIRDAAAAVKAELFAAVALVGFVVREWSDHRVRYVTDPDGSSHAILSITYLIESA